MADTELRRTFGIDVLHGQRCGVRRRLIALITEDQTAHKILAHLGLPTRAPPQSPARASPDATVFLDGNDSAGIDPAPLSWHN